MSRKPVILGGAYIKKSCGQFQLVEELHWIIPDWDGKYALGSVPLGFTCDGCTDWPDGFLWLRYRKACFVHDFLCRHCVETEADRFQADEALRRLVGGAVWGRLMFFGVRIYSKVLAAMGKVN